MLQPLSWVAACGVMATCADPPVGTAVGFTRVGVIGVFSVGTTEISVSTGEGNNAESVVGVAMITIVCELSVAVAAMTVGVRTTWIESTSTTPPTTIQAARPRASAPITTGSRAGIMRFIPGNYAAQGLKCNLRESYYIYSSSTHFTTLSLTYPS